MRITNKKGALDVSINSIVVIVFAVTMLGLGLAFINNYFSKIGVQTLPPPAEPSSSTPITIPEGKIIMDKSKPLEMTIKFFNENPAGANFALGIPAIDCYNDLGVSLNPAGAPKVIITSTPLQVNYATAAEFPIKIRLDPSVPAGRTYPCSVRFPTGTVASPGPIVQKAFFLEVK